MKNNKLKVVIDTNIFIKGWFFDSNPYCNKIMDLIDQRILQLLFAQDTIGELIYISKNFARYNIDNVQQRIMFLHQIGTLFYYSTSVNTIDTQVKPSDDPYDDMFLKCAIEGEADCIISDDFKHGLHKRQDLKFKVLNSEDFVKYYFE